MPKITDNWTPEQRADLVALVRAKAVEQIEGDTEMREMVDWMIEACGLTPTPELYRLVLLSSIVTGYAGTHGGRR